MCWGALVLGEILGCLWDNTHLTSWHMGGVFLWIQCWSIYFFVWFCFCLFFWGGSKGDKEFWRKPVYESWVYKCLCEYSRERTYMSLSICKLVILTRCLRSITETYDSYKIVSVIGWYPAQLLELGSGTSLSTSIYIYQTRGPPSRESSTPKPRREGGRVKGIFTPWFR